jgi:hypothetical protein
MKKLITISVLILALGLMACSKKEEPKADNSNEEIVKSEIGDWSDGYVQLSISESTVSITLIDGSASMDISIAQKVTGKIAGPASNITGTWVDIVPEGETVYIGYTFDTTSPNQIDLEFAISNYPDESSYYTYERINSKNRNFPSHGKIRAYFTK